jgi:hypothetical protein
LNDHLPHKELAAGKRPPGLTGQALKARRSPEAHRAMLQAMHDRWDEVPGALERLCAGLTARGVLIGSHDDHTVEDRLRGRALGATVSEFPETRAAAEAARAGGEGVIMGAPNLVRGGSHAGKVAAGDLVAAGLVDALASDYHYPAPARAAFRLERDGMELARAWALVSEGPARLLGLGIGGGWNRDAGPTWSWWRRTAAGSSRPSRAVRCPTWPGLADRFSGRRHEARGADRAGDDGLRRELDPQPHGGGAGPDRGHGFRADPGGGGGGDAGPPGPCAASGAAASLRGGVSPARWASRSTSWGSRWPISPSTPASAR